MILKISGNVHRQELYGPRNAQKRAKNPQNAAKTHEKYAKRSKNARKIHKTRQKRTKNPQNAAKTRKCGVRMAILSPQIRANTCNIGVYSCIYSYIQLYTAILHVFARI